jgi:uncharacterized Zn-binding protein involved in type VI secretion
MKRIRNILCGLFIPGAFIALLNVLHAQETGTAVQSGAVSEDVSSMSDLEVELQALEQTTPIPASQLPDAGTFWSAQHSPVSPEPWPPMPVGFLNVPAWPLGDNVFVLDDLRVNYTAMAQAAASSQISSGIHAMDESGGDFSPDFSFPTNSLWLQINGVSNGLAYLVLNGTTDEVYEVMSKTDLTLTNWNIEQELWPTTNQVSFTVPVLDRTNNLFFWARDWTGVTENGNTTPDWWFWKYFGTVALLDSDLDSQGNTLLDDYENGLDPNPIQFTLQFTNTYFNSSTASGTISVSSGTPFYGAILINDTNLADADWQPYTSSNVVVTFSSNGIYNVFVGLRGLPTNAVQTWMGAQLTYDTIPPTLAVTNPTSGTVSVPTIQLQGYANETLSSLMFDVSNATGIFTNQTGCLTGQFYDTNLLAYTTNYFQCYDVTLTNGVNQITLHATDLAGNTTTTNFSYTLSYAGVTNPPALTLIWPQSGAQISGTNFTVQAQVNDATATVTASITTTNGNTTTVPALVERSGAVWAQNLPLGSGTNVVTVTATNAAGIGSTTNFDVVQSAVTVTIDPLPTNELNQALVTVTGTVSDGSYNVWVNGVQATVSGDPTWVATNVPVNPTGTASFTVEAGLNLDNPLAGETVVLEQPSLVQAASYQENYQEQENDSGNEEPQTFESIMRTVAWASGVGGYSKQHSVNEYDGSCDSYVAWPTNWPDGETLNGTSCAGDYSESPNPAWQYASIPIQTVTSSEAGDDGPRTSVFQLSYTAQTQLELVAGGNQTGTPQLIRLTASAAGYSTLLVEAYEPYPAYEYGGISFESAGDTPVLASAIQILGQTLTPTTNAYVGETFVTLPAGAVQTLTPTISAPLNQNDYSVSIQPQDATFHIFDANSGQDLTTQTNTVIVGQQMNLYCQLSLTNETLTNFSWTIPGYAISNYVVASDSSSAVVVTNFSLNSSNVVFYWVDGASNRTIQCSAMVDGQKITAQATFNVLRPTAKVTPSTTSVNVIGNLLIFGQIINGVPTDGITFSNTITIPAGFSGSNFWIQVISSTVRNLQDTSTNHVLTQNGASPYGDTPIPYAAFDNTGTNPVDSPNLPLPSGYVRGVASGNFEMWMMFQPTNGIPVPLRAVNWSWSGSATNNAGTWLLESGATNSVNPTDFDTETYPLWNSDARNKQWIPPGSNLP